MTADPPSLPALSPVLRVADATKAIEFYTTVFGATERYRLIAPNSGRIAHAELQVGDSVLMLTQDSGVTSTAPSGGIGTIQLSLGVANVDATVGLATRAGCTILRPPADQFYGYRCANLRDPFGFEWMLSQRIEHLTPSEMQERWERLSSGQ